jgi:hypothetical protein
MQKRKRVLRAHVIEALACVALLAMSRPLAGQGTRMKGIGAFLMDRSTEISLARSAGPRGIGDSATVLVLGQNGYETAAKGSNGFVCFVGRGWSGPGTVVEREGRREAGPDVLDPKVLAPHCFNPAAAESVLKWHLLRTESLIAGEPVEDLPEVTAAALQSGKLRAPSREAFAYMTSPRQHLGDAVGRWRPHVMLYIPYATNEQWGSRGFNPDYPFVSEQGTAWSVVVIPISKFSDGDVAVSASGSR